MRCLLTTMFSQNQRQCCKEDWGWSARSFLTDSQRFLIHWIDQRDHEEAVTLFRKRNRRNLSLVDCTSFVVMKPAQRHYGLRV